MASVYEMEQNGELIRERGTALMGTGRKRHAASRYLIVATGKYTAPDVFCSAGGHGQRRVSQAHGFIRAEDVAIRTAAITCGHCK